MYTDVIYKLAQQLNYGFKIWICYDEDATELEYIMDMNTIYYRVEN